MPYTFIPAQTPKKNHAFLLGGFKHRHHHLRYEFGGVLIDLLAIGLIVYATRRK